jgi:hypothetical protein
VTAAEHVRLSAKDALCATKADRRRLCAAMEGPIDTSDSPEKIGPFNRIRRDANGRFPKRRP